MYNIQYNIYIFKLRENGLKNRQKKNFMRENNYQTRGD